MTVAEAELEKSGSGRMSDLPRPVILAISRERLMLWAVVVTILLALAGTASVGLRVTTGHDVAYGLIPLFDLNGEGSLPQVFSAVLLLAAAFLALAGGQAALREGTGQRRRWRLLALAFAVLAVDEVSSLHMLIDRPVAELFGLSGRLPAMVRGMAEAALAVVVLAAYVPFLRRLPRLTARRFVIAGAIYLGAAVGLDAVTVWIVDVASKGTAVYAVLGACEEVLEMAGLLVFIDACLAYLARADAALDLKITFRQA